MVKILKKKFFEVDIPLINDKCEAYAGSIAELENKVLKLDITRQLKGKSVDLVLKIIMKDGKPVAVPKKLELLPSFIVHMLHTGIDYVEDSFIAETKESYVVIKTFMITRKKVSRAVRRTLRNSAKNWLMDYLKTKYDGEVFEEILSNQLQKPLSLKLKKVYPLAVCEIKAFEIKKLHGKKIEEEIGKIEIKEESKESEGVEEESMEITETLNEKEPAEEKPKKKSKKTKEEKAK